VLRQAVLASPVFTARWRWAATHAFVLDRFRHGRKVSPEIQRMRADDLLAAVFPEALACQENLPADIPIPDHPLVRETMKDALSEAMDVEGLKQVLEGIARGSLRCLAVDTPVPSVFSREILNANPYAYLDDALLEERRAHAVGMRRVLPESVLEEVGRLDPEAIGEVRKQAWPDLRDEDELHDLLLSLVALPESRAAGEWSEWLARLRREGRAARAVSGERAFWVAAEKAKTFLPVFPGARFETPPAEIAIEEPARDDALDALLTRWMMHSGPVTASELAGLFGLGRAGVEQGLLRLEARGTILRGKFTGAKEETEWCERRLLARTHRLTLSRLRREIEPVTPAEFLRWLLRWQHLAPGTELRGEPGLFEALAQLEGFEAPANAWESQILARRVRPYDPRMLDELCLSGAVGWGRLSPRADTRRRVTPTSVAPITFFVRERADWMTLRQAPAEGEASRPALSERSKSKGLSHAARDVLSYLRERGASFFADLVRGTGRLKAEVETALWELVTAGKITADDFDNLRALVGPQRRAGQGRGRGFRPRHSAGRWALLFTGPSHPASAKTGRSGEPASAVALEAACRMLLERYGIVFRDLLARETLVPGWRDLLLTFRRMEDRGEVRGGRFVSGFPGEQFALPIAVDSLRAMRKQPPTGEAVTVSAADPLNLVGILAPGERVPAISGRFVSFRDGVPSETAERRELLFEMAAAR
jgi:ATP-dependent Lhr-like helicase